jgi:DNA-binding transcriptional LysR family regulator
MVGRVRPVLPDLSIRQLEYLVAVAEAPNWATAAESVGVSASALSQGMAELERRVGLPIFERHGRRRTLRPAAQPLLDHARQVLALTGDLTRWAERARTADEGTIRVGMIDAAAVHYYPETLRSFRAAHADLQFHLRVAPSSTLLELLAAGDLDLAVCVAPEDDPRGIDLYPVRHEQLAVYRPDGRRAGRPASWGPWVLFPTGSHTRHLIEVRLGSLGAPVEVVAESHQPEVLREMVQLGLGWTVLPVVQGETGERPLARARILTDRRLAVAVRAGSVQAPAVSLLQAALEADS